MAKPNRAANARAAKAKPIDPKLTFRVTTALQQEFKSACGRRGIRQDPAGVEAIRAWVNPPLPANDNCDCDEASAGMAVIALGAAALSGALIGGLGVYVYFTWVA